jgi:hypothetical protein
MEITITRASVLVGRGPDHVWLYTHLQGPFIHDEGQLCLKFEATANTGAQYCRSVLGIEAEIIRR